MPTDTLRLVPGRATVPALGGRVTAGRTAVSALGWVAAGRAGPAPGSLRRVAAGRTGSAGPPSFATLGEASTIATTPAEATARLSPGSTVDTIMAHI